MRRTWAAVGSGIWFALAPCVVAGLVPWWLTGWHMRSPLPYWMPLRVSGAVLVLAGGVVLIHAFVTFVVEGLGTPAPVAPTEYLVVGGLYRHVRNPMYLAVSTAIVGQALLLGQLNLLWYAAAVAIVSVAFVHGYEEPTLRQQFRDQYQEYQSAVPRWWPRLRPWKPADKSSTLGSGAGQPA